MKTVELTQDVARWVPISQELLAALADTPSWNTARPLAYHIRQHAASIGKESIEPSDGPIFMLKTGAKLYWSDSRGVAIISGYAQDGRDVDPYIYSPPPGRPRG